MKAKFFQFLSNVWILIKIKLYIPLPLKNHFYKGHRISYRHNWFCTSCHSVFQRLSFGKRKDEWANWKCPNCGSKHIVWSTFLFMAIVDKEPKECLLGLLEQTSEQLISWISKRKTL